jgi:hypothetical protein
MFSKKTLGDFLSFHLLCQGKNSGLGFKSYSVKKSLGKKHIL